jgi:hypothetical protein
VQNIYRVYYTWHYVPRIAVVVSRTRWENLHAGIAHRTVDGRVFVLHLAWHCDLRNQEFDGPNRGIEEYDPIIAAFQCPIFVVPDTEEDERLELDDQLEYAASLCRAFFGLKENRKISYCLGHFPDSAVYIDDQGMFRSLDTRYGLNCVTLVIEVFKKAKLPLVMIESWPEGRPQDVRQQRKTIGIMEHLLGAYGQQTTITQEKIDFNKDQIGKRRVAPEEIAGACLEQVEDLPTDFATCEPHGKDVVDLLDRLRYSRRHDVPLFYVPSPAPPLNSAP